MGHNMDMFDDGTISHEQSIIKIKIFAILRRALDYLFHEGRIFRVKPLESEFHGRFRRSVILEDAKGFLGPDEFAGGRSPAEAPRMTEPLSFSQISLTAPHFLVARPHSSAPLPPSLSQPLSNPLLLA